jgi:hypothetical protein
MSRPSAVDPRLPQPGTILTRPYKGQQLQVLVLTDDFAYAGRVYPSLSADAKAITGSHTNGYLFLRGNRNAENPAGVSPAHAAEEEAGSVTPSLDTLPKPSSVVAATLSTVRGNPTRSGSPVGRHLRFQRLTETVFARPAAGRICPKITLSIYE